MSNDKKDITIPNPAHHIGRFFKYDTAGAVLLSGMIGMVTGFGGAVSLDYNSDDIIADTQGTELSATVLASHQKTLSELKQQDYQWHKMKVEQDFGKLSTEEENTYTDLRNSFSQNAQQALFDLYTKGATNDGAAISEQDFEKQLSDLMRIIEGHANLKSINYDIKDVNPALLDEALAEIKLPTDNSVISQFKAVSDIQSYMADNKSDKEGTELLLMLTILFGSILGLPLLAVATAKPLSRTPRRITIKKAKPNH